MHTTRVTDDAGKVWLVFHNGDWSGEAMVRPYDSVYDVEKGVWPGEVTLPGFVLKNACRIAMAVELQDAMQAALDAWASTS